jgi:Helix-turn-helix domain/HNH endonuclease
MPANQWGEFPDSSNPETLMTRIQGKRLITENGCWEWLGTKNPKGYGMISIDGYMYTVHRVVAEICLGLNRKDQNVHALHSCDNPTCFNPDHLYLGTNDDNVQDRFDRNKWGKIAKLTPEQVTRIKIEYERGRSQREIATEYGVHQSTVSRIINNKRWSRLMKGRVV